MARRSNCIDEQSEEVSSPQVGPLLPSVSRRDAVPSEAEP